MSGLFTTLFRYREKKSPDKLGRYPQEVNIAAMPERRYLWTARVLVIFSAMSFSLTIMLALTLYLLLPLRGGKANLLSANPYLSSLDKVEPLEKNVNPMDVVTEQYIEKYIKLRHEIPKNLADLLYRWERGSEFYWLSSVGVFQEFSNKATYDYMTNLINQGLIRTVEIEWMKRLTNTLWQVQFHTVTSTHQQPDQKMVVIWRAYLRVEYEEYDLDDELDSFRQNGILKNPFGFKIKRYSIAYVGTPEEPLSYLEIAKRAREQHYPAGAK